MVDREGLILRAVILAWATIGFALLEGIVSIAFGVSDESVSLAGFGIQSLIEVASSFLVLWRFRAEVGLHSELGESRERRATSLIGILFGVTAVIILAASVHQLFMHLSPETTLPGAIVSLLSSSAMLYLWLAKSQIGRTLQSPSVLADSACTLACLQISLILLGGSLLFVLAPSLWWVDSVAAIVLAGLIGREGWEMVDASRSEEFSGSCGCDH